VSYWWPSPLSLPDKLTARRCPLGHARPSQLVLVISQIIKHVGFSSMRLKATALSERATGLEGDDHDEHHSSPTQHLARASQKSTEDSVAGLAVCADQRFRSQPPSATPSGAPKKAGKRCITDARRERNRKAQTRYRWKCKVRYCHGLESHGRSVRFCPGSSVTHPADVIGYSNGYIHKHVPHVVVRPKHCIGHNFQR